MLRPARLHVALPVPSRLAAQVASFQGVSRENAAKASFHASIRHLSMSSLASDLSVVAVGLLQDGSSKAGPLNADQAGAVFT